MMNEYIRWRAPIAVSVGLIVVSAVVVFFVQNPGLIDQLFGSQDAAHLSDDELIANFHRHRVEFDQLREMIKQDRGLARIGHDRTLPENPISVGVGLARVEEYRTLLKIVGAQGGIAVSSDRKAIELISTRRGFATHNSEKGYLYIEEAADKNLFTELDSFSISESGSGLRRIEGNWYLYFEGY